MPGFWESQSSIDKLLSMTEHARLTAKKLKVIV